MLVQARFRGCVLGPDESRRAFSLEGSLLQGTDFTNATLLSALLVDAVVALPQGVPLFSLPAGSQQKLNSQGLASLSNLFSQAGYPHVSPNALHSQSFTLHLRENMVTPNVYSI